MTGSLFQGRRPLLLDLFCGAGGAARGYQEAGFAVVGVDLERHPNYCGNGFIMADALASLRTLADNSAPVWRHLQYDAIHSSPPCQAFTAYRRKGHGVGDGYPDLIAKVRRELDLIGWPYVIENVVGAPLHDPITLCGSTFGLDVRRHRLFETNWPLEQPLCNHASQIAKGKRFPGATNRQGRYTCEVGVWRIPLETQKRAMGVDWDVSLAQLTEMIPPAYTEYVGQQLLPIVQQARAVAA